MTATFPHITTKRLKADFIAYVEKVMADTTPMIADNMFDKHQRDMRESARCRIVAGQAFVHLALEEGWSRAEAEAVVNQAFASDRGDYSENAGLGTWRVLGEYLEGGLRW